MCCVFPALLPNPIYPNKQLWLTSRKGKVEMPKLMASPRDGESLVQGYNVTCLGFLQVKQLWTVPMVGSLSFFRVSDSLLQLKSAVLAWKLGGK